MMILEVSTTAPEVFIVLAVISVLSAGAAITLLIARRKLYPIFGRELALVIPSGALVCGSTRWLSAIFAWGFKKSSNFASRKKVLGITEIAGSIISLHFALSPILDYSCSIAVLAEADMTLVALTTWTLRLIRYCFLYFAAQERFAKTTDPKASQWFNERKHWVSPRWLTFTLCLSLVIFVASSNLSFYLSPNAVAAGCANGILSGSLSPLHVYIVLVNIILVYTAFKIRGISDGFYIKAELTYCAIPAVPNGVVYVLHGRVGDIGGFAITNCLLVVFTQIFLAVSLWQPVIRSYRYENWLENQKLSTSRHHDIPLMVVLTDESYATELLEFKKHLLRELSFENYELWHIAHEFPAFAEHASELELAQRAMSIYRDYIQVESSTEANVSAISRKTIIADLRTGISNFDEQPDNDHLILSGVALNPSIFDDVKRSMYELMAKDPYIRWQILQRKKLEKPVRELQEHPERVWNAAPSPRHGPKEEPASTSPELQTDVRLLVSHDDDTMADIAAFQNPGQSTLNDEKVAAGDPTQPISCAKDLKLPREGSRARIESSDENSSSDKEVSVNPEASESAVDNYV